MARAEISFGREKGELRNFQKISEMSAVNLGNFWAGGRKKSAGSPPPPPPPIKSFYFTCNVNMSYRLFTLYNNTELTFFSDMTLQYWCNTMLFIVYNLWPNKYVYLVVRHCLEWNLLSNPRRIHSEEEDEEKEERGLPRALICCSTTTPSPPPPPPYTLRACCIAWGCVIRTHPPFS